MNEYGEPLDSNGYAPSLVEDQCTNGGYVCCYICGRTDRALQRHEIFHGALRDKSKKYGCWCLLCYECHSNVHGGKADEDALKRRFQQLAQEHYEWTREDFISMFGKSFL